MFFENQSKIKIYFERNGYAAEFRLSDFAQESEFILKTQETYFGVKIIDDK